MKNNFNELHNKLQDEIKAAKERIKLLEKYKYAYDYFLPLKRKRNPYLTSMRVIIAFRMFKEGMIQNDIAVILIRDHASVSQMFGKYIVEDHIYKETLKNMDQWIADQVYPATIGIHVRKENQKHKTDKWKLIYKLKPI